MVPFLVKPDDPEIQVLQDAFQFVTGDTEHKPFTIGGGTYAREFKKGASFGVNMPWIENPDWVGGEHGPDEGVSEELLKTSFKIYVLALAELQGLEDSVIEYSLQRMSAMAPHLRGHFAIERRER